MRSSAPRTFEPKEQMPPEQRQEGHASFGSLEKENIEHGEVMIKY